MTVLALFYTSLVRKCYSIAQLNFIIAKRSSSIFRKQYKSFPATTNIPEKLKNTHLNLSLYPLQILIFQLALLRFSFNNLLLNMYYLLSSLIFASTPFLVQPLSLSLTFFTVSNFKSSPPTCRTFCYY